MGTCVHEGEEAGVVNGVGVVIALVVVVVSGHRCRW